MSNEGWLAKIKRWIRRLFSRPIKKSYSPTILKRWYGKHCAVLQLERTTPGATATYRITSLWCDYLLTLDYLPDLFGEVLGEHEGEIIKLGSTSYPNYPASHRFAVFRLANNGASHIIGIWDCDLQGSSAFSYSLQLLAPRRAVFGVAARCLKIPHNHKTPSLTWENQIDRMNWLGLLEERIRGELQNPHHDLKACLVLVA